MVIDKAVRVPAGLFLAEINEGNFCLSKETERTSHTTHTSAERASASLTQIRDVRSGRMPKPAAGYAKTATSDGALPPTPSPSRAAQDSDHKIGSTGSSDDGLMAGSFKILGMSLLTNCLVMPPQPGIALR